jgi:hypothetical protein
MKLRFISKISAILLTTISVTVLTKFTPNLKSGIITAHTVQPFSASLYPHNSDSTAYRLVRSKGFLPLEIAYQWTDTTFDEYIHNATRSTARALSGASRSEGQSTQEYGSHLPRLRSLQSKVDPQKCYGTGRRLEILITSISSGVL